MLNLVRSTAAGGVDSTEAPRSVPRSFERVEGQVRDDAGKVRRGALAAERTNVVEGKGSGR